MKSILIIKKDSTAKNDIRDGSVEIVDEKDKIKIFEDLKFKHPINYSDYQVFDESPIYKNNTFYQEYAKSVFEVYFPSTYDTKSRTRLYTPEEKIVEEDRIKVFVYQWSDVEIPEDMNLIHYLNENDDFQKEDGQKIIMIVK